MSEIETPASPDIAVMTTQVVANYVAGNRLAPEELTALIRSVHAALSAAASGSAAEPVVPEVDKPSPARIRKSITDKGLVSFEDGKPYQTLKRHLTGRGMTVAQYKAKWGLPNDYPSTAPAYAAKRSELAKSMGLGRKPGTKAPPSKKKPGKKG